jgi:prophage maintenance system killer protein
LTRLTYPSIEQIIEVNKRILDEIRVDKRDRHLVWSDDAIRSALSEAKRTEGDVHDKAAVLLMELVKGHPFKSGNRRTAIAVASYFLSENGQPPVTGGDPKILAGIRLGIYNREQVKGWLKGE